MFKKILRKHSISSFKAESKSSNLAKSLGAFDLTLFGIGAIIGVGIFVLTGITAAKFSGPAVTVSYILAGVVAIFTAFAYLEMASIVPVAGSSYSYAYCSLGEIVAWVVAWFLMLEYSTGSGMIAVGWSGYMVGLLKHSGIVIPDYLIKTPFDGGIVNLPAVFIVMMLTALMYRGNKESAMLNRILVLVKLVAIIIFIVIAFPHLNMDYWNDFMPYGFNGVITGTATVMLSYVGFDALASASEESKKPSRDLPIAIILSLLICGVLYVLVAACLTLIVPYNELDNAEPMAYALRANGSNIGMALIAFGAIAGITTSLMIQIYGQSRVMYSIARDGLMPKIFSKVHNKLHTPYISIIWVGVLVSIIAGFVPIEIISNLANLGTLVAFIIVGVGVIVLRIKHPNTPRTFRTPAVMFTVPISVISCIYLLQQLLQQTISFFILWLFIGIAIYYLYGYRNSNLNFKHHGKK
jgi:basic amino acid/polyamine antiporter, APA family